jgi:peptidoglycan/xylan/chitin deacetylase (PgdA/CDA1 family)
VGVILPDLNTQMASLPAVTCMGSLWLMYHDVYTNLDSTLPRSAAAYHVSTKAFELQLQIIKDSGIPVVSPSEAMRAAREQVLVLTFDDGWAGTFQNALPLLEKYSLPAAIFVTRDFVGQRSFCERSMLAYAVQSGVEIGVHGTTHRMLSALSDDEIFSEFSLCKDFLEQIIAKPVHSASVPGGDIDDRIIRGAKKAGLKYLCTSQPGINHPTTHPFRLKRIAIRENTDSKDMGRFCHLSVTLEVFRWRMLEVPRQVLGMKNYSRLQRLLVDSKATTRNIFQP